MGRIADWFKYERLAHFPELRAFPREAALRRLEIFEREERRASAGWLRLAYWGLAFWVFLWIGGMYLYGQGLHSQGIWMLIPQWLFTYALHLRIRRRVAAKVEAELSGGRLKSCLECGYDLRGTTGVRCSECGALVIVPDYGGRPHRAQNASS